MKESSLGRPWKIAISLAVLASFILMVTVNALANILPLNGVNTGTLSDEIPNLFVPAGITFSVWGLIYLLLTGLTAGVLFLAFSKKAYSGAWEPLDGIAFIVNAIANALWIFAWHWRVVWLSLLIMLVILGTLIFLSERIFKRSSRAGSSGGPGSPRIPALLKFFLTTPIHVYLGWICVATIANVTALLVTLGWNGWGLDPRAWTVMAILAGLAVALALVFLRRAIAAPLVVVWAYAGIVMKRMPLDGAGDPVVWISAAAALSAIVIALAASVFTRRARARP